MQTKQILEKIKEQAELLEKLLTSGKTTEFKQQRIELGNAIAELNKLLAIERTPRLIAAKNSLYNTLSEIDKIINEQQELTIENFETQIDRIKETIHHELNAIL